jgi:hypothetical protein
MNARHGLLVGRGPRAGPAAFGRPVEGARLVFSSGERRLRGAGFAERARSVPPVVRLCGRLSS